MKKTYNRLTAFLLTMMLCIMNLLLLPTGMTAGAAVAKPVNQPMDSWSAPIKVGATYYNLHLWVADDRMGEWRSGAVYHRGNMHFINYELTNASTGALANDISFEAHAVIYDPRGAVSHEQTYSSKYRYKDDYGTDVSAARNYIGHRAEMLGKWKGTVSVTGDVTVETTVYWDVTVPYVNLHVWSSNGNMGAPYGGYNDPFELDQMAYLCYELTDLDNGRQLDGEVTGYNIDMAIYDPDGKEAYAQHYTDQSGFKEGYSRAYTSIGKQMYMTGQWTGVVTMTGDIELELTVSWTVTDGVVTPVIPSTPTDQNFIWGQDNWSFDNSSDYYTYGYYINSKMLYKLGGDFGLTNVERELLQKNMGNDMQENFGGACFGITISEILAKNKKLDLSRYDADPIVNRNTNTEDMLSLTNFVFELQNIPCMNQIARNTSVNRILDTRTQDEFIRTLESAVCTGDGLVNLIFGMTNSQGQTSGLHSILAYGAEKGNWSYYFNGSTHYYDRRILIADPNYLSQNYLLDDACLYYRSDDYSWMLPAYCYGNTYCYWDASFGSNEKYGFIRNVLKHTGMKDYTDLMVDTPSSVYLPGLAILNSSQENPCIRTIEGTGNDSLGDSGRIEPYFNTDATGELHDWYAYGLGNPTASYELYDDTAPASFETIMDYEDVVYISDVENTTNVYFSPKGQIELKGKNLKYDFSLITNKERCVTDWFRLEVSGQGGNNMLCAISPEGYVLRGDDLHDVDLFACNTTHYAYLTFSTNYKNVLVYEISPTNIGVAADTDNDGKYETVIAEGETLSIGAGDVNADRLINASDAALVLIAAANIGAGNDPGLTEVQADNANVNGDQDINATDAAIILIYAAAVGAGQEVGDIRDFTPQ
ncbi:MAG: dockerin type I repeat-containing protein [Oscillospiraceae bacterium]|nr:dockerin type I repeat-containing protein [Oscillospiraceae bacterium]